MNKQYSKADVLALMRRKQGKRSAREFALELGISAPYLSDIYAGKREPGPTVLGKLGLVAVVTYQKSN